VPLVGKLIFHLLPIRRRIVLSNLRRVFADVVSEAEIRRLAQAHYAHLGRLVVEFLTFSWLRAAQRTAMVRVENIEAILRAHARGKGVLVLTGHFGNWEVASVAGMAKFPQYNGLIHFLRRPLQPGWFDTLVTRRFRRAGLGTLPKKGALDAILERLGAGGVIVFVFDQYAAGSDGIPGVLWASSRHLPSLAILALGTGAPVIPAASWRARRDATCCASRSPSRGSTTTIPARRPASTPGPTTPPWSA
jgi:KDO2-lipid IV(A) lauroyltransferase